MVGPEASLVAIARSMADRRIHRVIVADEERFPLGIVTSMDLLAALSR
jgi:CBS domain-containing protein